jgi:hypothetical protein
MVYVEVPIMATSMFIGYARIVEKVKKAGATSEETARTAEQLNLRKGDLERLSRWIKKTSDERFYVECKDGKHC